VAKRGYTRDTIRGGPSEWDVSRPFSSFARLLGRLVAHPAHFFEVLPRIPDIRAPAMFLGFCSVAAAVLWLLLHGWLPALLILLLTGPGSAFLAGLCRLGTPGGRYGFTATWRTLVYPLGFFLTLSWIPPLQLPAAAYFGGLLVAVGLWKVREIPFAMAALNAAAVATLLFIGVRGILQVS
jgi:hypothetical protein